MDELVQAMFFLSLALLLVALTRQPRGGGVRPTNCTPAHLRKPPQGGSGTAPPKRETPAWAIRHYAPPGQGRRPGDCWPCGVEVKEGMGTDDPERVDCPACQHSAGGNS